MFGGAYYIWIMLTFFIGCATLMLTFTAILLLGHWLEKKETGSTHKFLELPKDLRPEQEPPQSPANEEKRGEL